MFYYFIKKTQKEGQRSFYHMCRMKKYKMRIIGFRHRLTISIKGRLRTVLRQ